jgi:predicted aspartyl protease
MTQTGLGHFDAHGNACLKFHLCGVRHEPPGIEYTGIIDTGFTGFVQLPLAAAIELALPLEGTTTVTLADGSTAAKLTAQAEVTLFSESEYGTVIIEFHSPEILIGMDFLRRFKRGLVVSRQVIGLVPESELPDPDQTEPTAPDPDQAE